MWEFLPIQTKQDKGRPYTIIQRNFPYPRSSDVRVAPWKEVPKNIQDWALSAWEDAFECVRNPVAPDDLIAWIPGLGILTAKKCRWTDAERSFVVSFVSYIYVHPATRGQQVSTKLILSLCYECSQQWKTEIFAFEIEKTPPSLIRREAIPFLSFDYVWIPFLAINEPWIELSWGKMKKHLRQQHGFHSDYTGWKAYRHPSSEDVVVLDAHNDIVDYSSFSSALCCVIPGLRGAYIRIFSPLGRSHVFLENFYFEPTEVAHRLV
jgi:hypothetical protein